MSSIADRIKIAQDKDEMLRKALERIVQLYTDKSHFVYELLQNAEDVEANSIRFIQYPDRLEVLHDGKPFTFRNLQGLCDIGKSDKVDNLNQIGEFGVGFKSVFGICDTVKLFSAPQNYKGIVDPEVVQFAVEIKDFTRPEDIEWEAMDKPYTTRFVFPYCVGYTFSGFKTMDALRAVLSAKLQNLGITTLLFMKNLETIEYQIRLDDLSTDGEYLLDKVTINDHCELVSAFGSMGKGDSDFDESYLKFSRPLAGLGRQTVDIAFPVKVDANKNYECVMSTSPFVSVYFPTETESKLDFIVQGPYRTTPNRSSIPADDDDNIRFANETAVLLRDTILELRETDKFNMSFMKALPLSAKDFDNYSLFYPLHETVKNLFESEKIIPDKAGGYVAAKHAKIARQEKLASVLTDELLSELIDKRCEYHWLPTFLTETNREYERVYRFLTGELKIGVIRPEDLRIFFANNPDFLPARTDDWLVELYDVLDNVANAFSKAKNETNMLTADIVKTTTGAFVAPYRKTESKQYIPNVFLPSAKIQSDEINTVDPYLYDRCRHFFDDILQLQKPNEYEFIVKDIRKRYFEGYVFEEDRHISDVKYILKYLKNDDYRDEISNLIKEVFLIRCTDGEMRNSAYYRLYLPITADGINIEAYYRNVVKSNYYVDTEFYLLHDISIPELVQLGVRDSILTGETTTNGVYDNGSRGKMPGWWTSGEFRWRLSLDSIKDVLEYISRNPSAKDSILKSKTIFRMLFENEKKLVGEVFIGGSTSNLKGETCELIKTLRGERSISWDRKWLYAESMELVAAKSVSKHDISTAIYGKIQQDSPIYELLGFRKTEADEVDELKKSISKAQLDAFFESELKQRFGVSSAELSEKYGDNSDNEKDEEDEASYEFPVSRVKNWDTLSKHAAEMLIFADPVKYNIELRNIRVSNHPKEIRAYLHNMYRYEGVYKYACQMCHKPCNSFETAELFYKPEVELDPMYLCLCPNCATEYRALRNNESCMQLFRERILEKTKFEVTNGNQVIIPINDNEIWFSQTHFAEIQELLKLSDEVKEAVKNKSTPSPLKNDNDEMEKDENEKHGLAVFEGYIGKNISRAKDGFAGKIKAIDGKFFLVDASAGEKAGKTVKIEMSFVLKANSVYTIED